MEMGRFRLVYVILKKVYKFIYKKLHVVVKSIFFVYEIKILIFFDTKYYFSQSKQYNTSFYISYFYLSYFCHQTKYTINEWASENGVTGGRGHLLLLYFNKQMTWYNEPDILRKWRLIPSKNTAIFNMWTTPYRWKQFIITIMSSILIHLICGPHGTGGSNKIRCASDTHCFFHRTILK